MEIYPYTACVLKDASHIIAKRIWKHSFHLNVIKEKLQEKGKNESFYQFQNCFLLQKTYIIIASGAVMGLVVTDHQTAFYLRCQFVFCTSFPIEKLFGIGKKKRKRVQVCFIQNRFLLLKVTFN